MCIALLRLFARLLRFKILCPQYRRLKQLARPFGCWIRTFGLDVAITNNADSVKPQGMKKVHTTDPSVLCWMRYPASWSPSKQDHHRGLAGHYGPWAHQCGCLRCTDHLGCDLNRHTWDWGLIWAHWKQRASCRPRLREWYSISANGISDPAKIKAKHDDVVLKQDDDWLHSAVVSMGTSTL